jgi:hypothetical protein
VKAAHHKGHTHKHAHHNVKHRHHTAKHHPVHHRKHATKHAHHVHAKATHAGHAKARGLALSPGDVACCTAEALAAALCLQGVSVSDEDVLALYWHTASDPDAGASILATLVAAWRFGLGGIRPAWYMEAATGELLTASTAPLILGLQLPEGPHTVLAEDGRWWSWGEPWCPCDFPDAVVEEAWAVEWAVAA